MVVVVAVNFCTNLYSLRTVGDNHLALYGIDVGAIHTACCYDADAISCRYIAFFVKREAFAGN